MRKVTFGDIENIYMISSVTTNQSYAVFIVLFDNAYIFSMIFRALFIRLIVSVLPRIRVMVKI